jgi:hypothetical protein
MKKNTFSFSSEFVRRWLLVAIILAGIFVRFWKMEYMPLTNDADELAYVWAGQSLIEFGVPISWSSFTRTDTQWHWVEMKEAKLGESETPVTQFVRPWFDHSFVLPLLVGGWVEIAGYRFPEVPPALWYRLPFLAIAGINLWLIYAIAKKAFGEWPAMFALTLATFSPIFIFAQRMVVSENLISMFVMLSIYLFITDRPIWSVVLATALSGLVKLPGLSIAPVIGMSLLAEKKYQKAFVYGGGVLAIIIAGYGLYGASIDLPAFVSAMKDQSSRLLGWSNPVFTLSQPGFHTKALLDLSYYLVLFFGVMAFCLPATRERKILLGAVFATWFTVWVTSAEQDMLGWYKIPFFCMMLICSASAMYLALHGLKKADSNEQSNQLWILIDVLLVVMLLNNLGLVRYPTQPLPEAQLLRVLVGGVLVSVLTAIYLKWQPKIAVAICIGALAVFALQTVFTVDQYFDALCRDRMCQTPVVTFSQLIKKTFLRGE